MCYTFVVAEVEAGKESEINVFILYETIKP